MPQRGTGRHPGTKKYVGKMKIKYYLILITMCCVPRTFLGTYKLVDGLFSDSSGVLMKYFIQPVDPRVLY